MASSNMNAGEMVGTNVPQWKRDLIQRRRQQSKVLASNGASVKLCSAVIGASGVATESVETPGSLDNSKSNRSFEDISGVSNNSVTQSSSGVSSISSGSGVFGISSNAAGTCSNTAGVSNVSVTSTTASPAIASSVSNQSNTTASSRGQPRGAYSAGGAVVAGTTSGIEYATPVACSMRLEADLSFCSDTEDVANGSGASNRSSTDMDRKTEHGDHENEDYRQQDGKRGRSNESVESEEHRASSRGSERIEREVLMEASKRKSRFEDLTRNRNNEDAESDSSEELQYGPGIVNKLRSKYLNLTLKETNSSRASVQRFRRAASLEDLLDREEETAEKTTRKYAKRNATGATAKTDRYRNASRGNESMKRARSVETLMRYNVNEDSNSHVSSTRSTTNGVRQEPVNDHIILVDRTSVKIESRLSELDRPKALNKPKRIKPVVADTERPPPDLVKTTMRIFEGSARRVKPKGEVALKVATFKTINDTYKAQNQKKIVPKPPLQPKPFVNGNSKPPTSPKKIILPQKPTAELIEKQDGQEEYHIDGVITDPIVQSVSSVVSKFQQIEKSHSPSPSPEPSFRLRFSPAPSPEPSSNKLKSSLEINVKSPPVTPVLSPRISSPRLHSPPSPLKEVKQGVSRVQSPPSPVKDVVKQNSSPVHKPVLCIGKENIRQTSTDTNKFLRSQNDKESNKIEKIEKIDKIDKVEKIDFEQNSRQSRASVERTPSPEQQKKDETIKDTSSSRVENEDIAEETDGPRTISRSALDNIEKAGTTMQFSFSGKSTSTKTYLPGFERNGEKEPSEESSEDRNTMIAETKMKSTSSNISAILQSSVTEQETISRLQGRLEPEKMERTAAEDEKEEVEERIVVENKPVGAICSLGLIKSTTTTSYPQNNESKTIRCQKESPSPPQKQIGIIRPLVSTKTQHPQQNLSNRELEKNLINRVKSIEQPTKVVVSLKSADEIQPAKKSGAGGGGGTGLWETKSWNQQNNTMVFNFSNRKDVPDYIENDGLFIRRKREKPKVGEGGIIVLDATLDASTTDDSDWEISGGPPSPCDVSFLNDNVLINGRSNLSKTPRNHKHRIQFDDTATRTFEYPSEASMLEGESSVDGETSGSAEQSTPISNNKTSTSTTSTSLPSLLGGGGLASYTPSKVDLTSEGFELGVTRATSSSTTCSSSGDTTTSSTSEQQQLETEVDYLKPAQDAGAWGSETTGDLLY